MPTWAAVSVGYFLYVIALASAMPGIRRAGRVRAGATALVGLAVALPAGVVTAWWLQSLLLPVAALLLAYRSSGFLWRAPMPRIEAALAGTDRALRVPAIVCWMPRLLAEFLELAYAGVYPLIPIALVLHFTYAPTPDVDWFWTVILLTDYACFAMLPWVQTRPPRAIEAGHPWQARLRVLNLHILDNTSIRMNTIPSGHAAEALACALIVMDAPAAIVAWMFFNAGAISAGAVFGRYHYSIDVIAGWIVALVTWAVLRN